MTTLRSLCLIIIEYLIIVFMVKHSSTASLSDNFWKFDHSHEKFTRSHKLSQQITEGNHTKNEGNHAKNEGDTTVTTGKFGSFM